MRNIERVILWGLPPTFCSLVQRAGRAGRDLTMKAEAILIVSKSVMDEEISKDDLDVVLAGAVIEAEALNREVVEEELTEQVSEALDTEGVRITGADESDAEEEPEVQVKRKKRYGKDTHIREVKALSEFVQTKECRRKVWDQFFENEKKCQSLVWESNMRRYSDLF